MVKLVELQAQAKDNIVRIKGLLYSGGATFNLPSGIQPLTYYEARTKGGTASNVSTGAGNTIVNVTVGDYDNSPRALDNLSRAVTDGIRRAQANQLANDVKSYTRYYSMLR